MHIPCAARASVYPCHSLVFCLTCACWLSAWPVVCGGPSTRRSSGPSCALLQVGSAFGVGCAYRQYIPLLSTASNITVQSVYRSVLYYLLLGIVCTCTERTPQAGSCLGKCTHRRSGIVRTPRGDDLGRLKCFAPRGVLSVPYCNLYKKREFQGIKRNI